MTNVFRINIYFRRDFIYMRTILFIILFTVSNCIAFAQPFFRIAGGYGIPFVPGQKLEMTGYPYTGTGSTVAWENVYEKKNASLYAGWQGEAAAGYWFSHMVGAEIALNAGLKTRKMDYTTGQIYPVNYADKTVISTYSKLPEMLIPSIVLRNNDYNFLYVKLGMVLPLSKKIYTENNSGADNKSGYVFFDKSEMTTKYNVGINLAVGMDYYIGKKIAITGELAYMGISFEAQQSNLVACTVNGGDLLSSRSENQKQVNYYKGYQIGTLPYNLDAPSAMPSYKIPFGNLAFKLGIAYNL